MGGRIQRRRTEEGNVGRGEGEELCARRGFREYIFFIPAQVSVPSPADVTLTHVKQREEGGKKRLKLENLIYLIISQNN